MAGGEQVNIPIESGYEDLHGTTPTMEYKRLLNENIALRQNLEDRLVLLDKLHNAVCEAFGEHSINGKLLAAMNAAEAELTK